MSELGVDLKSGIGLKNLRANEWIIILHHKVHLMKLQFHATGPSDHSDLVSINRLSNKKAYTERGLPPNILLSEIKNEFITSAVLAA